MTGLWIGVACALTPTAALLLLAPAAWIHDHIRPPRDRPDLPPPTLKPLDHQPAKEHH